MNYKAKEIELDLPCHRQESADGDANDGPVDITYNIDIVIDIDVPLISIYVCKVTAFD